MANKKEKASAKGKPGKQPGPSAATQPNASKTDSKQKDKAGKGKVKSHWKGSSNDGGDLEAELAALGLRVKNITADGNCFFRSLGDQLEGNEGMHVSLRQRIMAFIEEHEEDYAPFVEDDESFGTYVARMRKEGQWAGYMEVVAASRALPANLTIYQAGQPRWTVRCEEAPDAPMLHLSYHDGMHYNSVRCTDDYGHGPPAPVVISGDGTMVTKPRQAQSGEWDEHDVDRVVGSTVCTDRALVRRMLEEAKGDVDAAIEKVIELLAIEGEANDVVAAPSAADAGAAKVHGTEPAQPPPDCSSPAAASEARPQEPLGLDAAAASSGVDAQHTSAQRSDGGEAAGGKPGSDPPGSTAGTGLVTIGTGSQGSAGQNHDRQPAGSGSDKGGDPGAAPAGRGLKAAASSAGAAAADAKGGKKVPANNKRCPCGSGRKYKACCGTAAAAAERRRAAAGAVDGADPQQAAVRGVVAQVAALVI